MGNKVKGTTSVKLGIYETSTDTQLEEMLGDVKEMVDGRKFRLCQNSTSVLVPGLAVQTKADTAYTEDIVVTTAAAAGGYTITVTNFSSHEALSVNELKDGYLCCNAGSGELGHGRKIKANTAAAAGAACTITVYDAFTDSIAITSTVGWTYPMYKNVVVASTDGAVIGVPVCDVAASTATVPVFFWAQTHGPCPMLAGGTCSRGNASISDDNGAIIDGYGTAAAIIGNNLQSFDDTDVGWVNLTIE